VNKAVRAQRILQAARPPLPARGSPPDFLVQVRVQLRTKKTQLWVSKQHLDLHSPEAL